MRRAGVTIFVVLAFALTAWAASAQVAVSPWPGGQAIVPVDPGGSNSDVLSNMSGFAYEASGTSAAGAIWAVRNGPERLYRFVWDGGSWRNDTRNGWTGSGKQLRYRNGTGQPDSEGIVFTTSPAAGMYISTERDNARNAIYRDSILRFDLSATKTGSGGVPELWATNEWDVTSILNLPATGAANLGLEGLSWIPDSILTSKRFFDESKGRAYNPADYPDHAGGLFFVGVEANGDIHAFALNHTDNTFTKIASVKSGFSGVMALEFDREQQILWAVCDDTCGSRYAVMEIDASGKLAVTKVYDKPTGMPSNPVAPAPAPNCPASNPSCGLNLEGFAVAAEAECSNGLKPAFFAVDGAYNGHEVLRGSVPCGQTATTIRPPATGNGGLLSDSSGAVFTSSLVLIALLLGGQTLAIVRRK